MALVSRFTFLQPAIVTICGSALGLTSLGLFPVVDSLISPFSFIKRTFQPSNIRRQRKHGFLHRLATSDGRQILANRRNKGRKRLAA